MANLEAASYFKKIHGYLHNNYITDHGSFSNAEGNATHISMTEPIQVGATKVKKTVSLSFSGKAFVVNLEQKGGANSDDPALYHFLDNQAKPWARRCDFVVFQCVGQNIRAYLFEFKSKSINANDIRDQIKNSLAWCKTLHSAINHYQGYKKRIKITKYVLSTNEAPEVYLCDENLYLNADHSIRFYRYDDLDDMSLDDLDREHEEFIS